MIIFLRSGDCKEVKELALLLNEDAFLEKVAAVIVRLRLLFIKLCFLTSCY